MIEAYTPTITPVFEAPEDVFTSPVGEKLSAQDTLPPADIETSEQEIYTVPTIALMGAGAILVAMGAATEEATAQAREEALRQEQLQAVRAAISKEMKKHSIQKPTTMIEKTVKPAQQAA
jgi:hypothetical protein